MTSAAATGSQPIHAAARPAPRHRAHPRRRRARALAWRGRADPPRRPPYPAAAFALLDAALEHPAMTPASRPRSRRRRAAARLLAATSSCCATSATMPSAVCILGPSHRVPSPPGPARRDLANSPPPKPAATCRPSSQLLPEAAARFNDKGLLADRPRRPRRPAAVASKSASPATTPNTPTRLGLERDRLRRHDRPLPAPAFAEWLEHWLAEAAWPAASLPSTCPATASSLDSATAAAPTRLLPWLLDKPFDPPWVRDIALRLRRTRNRHPRAPQRPRRQRRSLPGGARPVLRPRRGARLGAIAATG